MSGHGLGDLLVKGDAALAGQGEGGLGEQLVVAGGAFIFLAEDDLGVLDNFQGICRRRAQLGLRQGARPLLGRQWAGQGQKQQTPRDVTFGHAFLRWVGAWVT
jgi:hypothetical protein